MIDLVPIRLDYNEISGREGLGKTISISVLANDLFMWGAADSCEISSNEELVKLLKMAEQDPDWGVTHWCCIQRNMQPQKPMAEWMKKAGGWNAELEALPANPDDAIC